MSGSTFGTLFRVTTWGESHGPAIGAVIDGCPAGLPLGASDVQPYLDRRRPGQNRYTTARKEADQIRILSGIFEGRTTGTPISMLVENTDQRSRDYGNLALCYRPGHADLTFAGKYGIRDYRGGGRSSGRETIGRVAGGAVACKMLDALGIRIFACTTGIGGILCDPERSDPSLAAQSALFMPDPQAEEQAALLLERCIRDKTSVGSIVSCRVSGLPGGLGEPVFDKLDAQLGKALFSIGAVKAVEIGDGIRVSSAKGHENNDAYGPEGKLSNHAGGIYGGISDGSELSVRVHFKPTPSIARPQNALYEDGTVRELVIGGRHDPVIGPRAVVVVECMTALTVADLLLQNMGSTMDGIARFYQG